MRPENLKMLAFLRAHYISATPKWIATGSMRGCWRMSNAKSPWTPELVAKLTALGFRDFQGQPLGPFSGNGGRFSVMVRGHEELAV